MKIISLRPPPLFWCLNMTLHPLDCPDLCTQSIANQAAPSFNCRNGDNARVQLRITQGFSRGAIYRGTSLIRNTHPPRMTIGL